MPAQTKNLIKIDPAANPARRYIRCSYLAALFLLLTLSPLLRGGTFFPEQLLPVLFFVGLIFIIFLAEQRPYWKTMELQALDICFLALGLAYLLSLTNAVSLHSALLEIMKIFAGFMVYWIARNLSQDGKSLKRLLAAVYLAAIVLALVGWGAAMGWVSFPGAYEDGHIRSTLQYHNALAIYLASAALIGWALGIQEANPIRSIVSICCNYFLLVILAGTMSRGTVILYPIAAAAFFLLISANDRGKAYSHLVLSLPLAWFTAAFVYSALHSNQPELSFIILLGGLGIVALAAWFYTSRLSSSLEKASTGARMVCALLAGLISLLLIMAGSLYMSHQVTGSAANTAPQNVADKFGRLSVGEHSVQERLTTYKDALKIIKDYPFTGAGGGSWRLLYHQYATKFYTCNEMHNFYLKTLLEAGIPGLMALLAMCFAFLGLIYKIWREAAGEDRSLLAAAAIIVMLTGLHSAFDFDLSIPAVAFMFFAIIGGLQGHVLGWRSGAKSVNNKTVKNGGADRNGPVFRIILSALGLVLAAGLTITSALFYTAQTIGDKGSDALKKGQLNQAERLFARAARLDRSEARYPLNLALINSVYFREKGDRTYYTEALSYAALAQSLDPYNLENNAMLLRAYKLLQRTDLQLKACQRVIDGNPFIGQSYETLAKISMDIAWACLDKKQLDGARQYFVLVLQTRNKMPPNVEGAVSRLNLAAGQSALFLGEFEPAQKYLENSKSDPACAKVAERWLPAVKWMENRKHDRQDKRVTEQDLAPLMAVLQGY